MSGRMRTASAAALAGTDGQAPGTNCRNRRPAPGLFCNILISLVFSSRASGTELAR
jgi:hypothetical protein